MRFHSGWNEIFSFRCLVNFLQLFTWYKPKWNSLRVLFHCGHFDRNEISLRMINYYGSTTLNEIIWKETSAHAFISSKQKWLAFIEWTVFLGHPQNEISFHFAPNQYCEQNFIYGALKFHSGSYIDSL